MHEKYEVFAPALLYKEEEKRKFWFLIFTTLFDSYVFSLCPCGFPSTLLHSLWILI